MKEENENQDRMLDNFFAKAKEEQPIVELEDVKKLVFAQSTAMVGQSILSRYKYWWMGGFGVFIGAVFYFAFNHSPSPLSREAPLATVNNSVQEQTLARDVQAEVQNEASTLTTITTNINTDESNKLSEKPANQISSASAQELSEANTKKEGYYFQGDAKINFENEGANVNMVIGDELKRLEINGTIINENEYSKYEALIQKGKALKAEADKSSSGKTDAEKHQQQKNREVMNELIKQLQSDKMIDEAGHFEFRITGSKVFINNNEQSESMFVQYKNLYETVSGNRLNAKSNVRIKH